MSTGVEIDSRRIQPGDLFVAIAGGVDIRRRRARAGRRGGARPGRSRSRPWPRSAAPSATAATRASSASPARPGRRRRRTSSPRSAGRMLRTVAAEQSHNNEIGLPLTLTRIQPDTRARRRRDGHARARPGRRAVRDRAARHRRDHDDRAGAPRAVRDGRARRAGGGRDRRGAPAGGIAVVPADEPLLEPYLGRARSRGDHATATAGTSGSLAFDADDAGAPRRRRLRRARRSSTFNFRVAPQRDERPRRARRLRGARASARGGAAAARPRSPSRAGARRRPPLPGGGLLINDCYNANPVSMAAALDHLAERARGRRRVAVLGDMAELGDRRARLPRRGGRGRRPRGRRRARRGRARSPAATSRAPRASPRGSGRPPVEDAAARAAGPGAPGRLRARQGLPLDGARGARRTATRGPGDRGT